MACTFELNVRDSVIQKALDTMNNGSMTTEDKLKFYEYINSNEFLNSEYNKTDSGVLILVRTKDGSLTRQNARHSSRILVKHFDLARANYVKSVRTQMANRHTESLKGFSSSAAKSEAIDHSADVIISAYAKVVERTGKSRPRDIAAQAARDIRANFKNNIIEHNLATEAEKGNKAAKEALEQYKKDVAEITAKDDNFKALKYEFNEARKNGKTLESDKRSLLKKQKAGTIIEDETIKLKELDESIKALGARFAELKAIIPELNKELTELKQKHINGLIDMINNEALNFTMQHRNYTSLVKNVTYDTNGWFADVFNVAKLSTYSPQFDNVIANDELANSGDISFRDEVEVNEDIDSVDEFSKHWSDSLDSDFAKGISTSVIQRLGKLYHLAEPVGIDGKVIYSLTPNLGTKYTMDVRRTMATIYNYGDFSSTDRLINSLEIISAVQPEMYGLSKLVHDMKNDYILANEIFHAFASPKMKKAVVEATADGVNMRQSNKTIATTAAIIFNYQNDTRHSYRSAFQEAHADELSSIEKRITNATIFTDSKAKTMMTDKIYNILRQYVPRVNRAEIVAYLEGKGLSEKEREGKTTKEINQEQYKKLIGLVAGVVEGSRKAIDSYNDAYIRFTEGYEDANGNKVKGSNQWYAEMAELRRFAEGMQQEEYDRAVTKIGAKPYLDPNSVNIATLEANTLELAKEMSTVTIVKNELNTMNAEGNLASDVIPNSSITNLLKQIHYAVDNNDVAGLEKLKDFVTASKQYAYSPIFFGVTDEKGNLIKPGLFTREANGKIGIHPRAKEMIDIALFDGVKNNVSGNNAMYSGLSKEDYFITQLLAYSQALSNYDDNKGVKRGGYFLRTPSDASKNFILRGESFITGTVYNNNDAEVKNAIDEFKQQLLYGISFEEKTAGNVPEMNDEAVKQAILRNISSKNVGNIRMKDFSDVINLLNGRTETLNSYSNKLTFVKSVGGINYYIIPVHYVHNDKVVATFYTEVSRSKTDVTSSYKVVKVHHAVTANSINDMFDINEGHIIDELTINGAINAEANTSSIPYHAFRRQLLGEINNFIENLNNVFVNTDGTFVTKDSTQDLFERYLYNGSIVKNGKLTGNIFNFSRLFELSNYKAGEELINTLLLYGEATEALMSKNDNGGLTLNLDRNDIIAVDSNGRIKFTPSKELLAVVNSITQTWMNEYRKDIVRNTTEFRKLYTNLGFNLEQVIDFTIDNTLQLMNYDDLFEGDGKFYKSAIDMLKRAKETQAGGKSYGNIDISDTLGGALVERTNKNGAAMEVVIGKGTKHEVKIPIRNGFRAVTVENTSKPSDTAKEIFEEVYQSVIGQVQNKKVAEKIADNIAKGYFGNTTINDAQSYITLEEFVARKHADGSIEQYRKLLEKLYDPNVKLEDIDMDEVNAKIQAQKNFYFDKQFDAQTGIYYPRQIKNAEYVLIPKVIEGTSLKTLYDIMKKHDIGQLNTRETSKAANKNVLEFWDKSTGEVKAEQFAEKVAQGIGVDNYYYRYLYKQQDVVDHLVDAENKAGVQIMKKIIDNVPEHLEPQVQQFYNNFIANIKDSFDMLLNRLGWKVNEDGSLVQRDGDEQLDFEDFYRRARNEARRLGLDSNFIDYLTVDELGVPKMPNYMNNVSTKLESIAQSIFNSSITRQKLPGWHAVQISPLGISETVKDENGNSRKLRYHPAVVKEDGTVVREAYAEVLVPRWSKLIPKGYDVSKLAEEGLDIQIGYRIPTEGKQSVSVIKIVGFLDDIEGSKVVVPEEWVTQTGSDFDVDTMYVISPELVVDKTGYVHKVIFDDSTETSDTQRRYVRYIQTRLKDLSADSSEIAENTKALRAATANNKINKAKEANDELFGEKYQEQKEVFAQLTPKDRLEAIKIYTKYAGKEKFVERHSNAAEHFTKLAESAEELPRREVLQHFAAVNAALAEQSDITSKLFDNVKSLKDKVAAAREAFFKEVEAAAVENNLISFEEFNKLSIEEQNTKQARNNKILDAIITIMRDPSSKEENYSRSNFDDLGDGMKRANLARTGNERGNVVTPSVYNPLDQIKFMENAMGGATLKAFSVTRDGFVSISNRAKTTIKGLNIEVTYDLNDDMYDEELIKRSYPNYRKNNDGTITVVHDKLGWSTNNRNIVGKILTSYSSQTTAHILDAVKEGSIFNENRFTFGTFKTLVDIGVDYDTAVAFLMQPVVTSISNENNKSTSVYDSEYVRPIDNVIRNLAIAIGKKHGVEINGREVNDVLIELIENDSAREELSKIGVYRVSKTSVGYPTTLAKSSLIARLNAQKEGISDEQYLLQDLSIALTFKKLHSLTGVIEATARVMNSDKYGAKQSVHATRAKIDEIVELSDNENKAIYVEHKGKPTGIYLISDKTQRGLVNSVFPTKEDIANTMIEKDDDSYTRDGYDVVVEDSVYPSLAAFYKFTTVPSVIANSQLFSLQNPNIVAKFNAIFNSIGVAVAEERYKEMERTYVSYVYQQAPFINEPITINERGEVVIDEARADKYQANSKINSERDRIMGFDNTSSYHRENVDINNPTFEDIAWFNTLTPAQKVMWVKTNFTDGAGVFDFLNASLYNSFQARRDGFSKQTITFSDQITDIETMYAAFKESFYSKNDFIRLAAIDLVKYAFVSEGFRFKKGGISRIIANESLYGEVEQLGMNLINQFNEAFNANNLEEFESYFVRSHTDYIKKLYIKKGNNDKVSIALRRSKKYSNAKDGAYLITNKDVIDAIDSKGGDYITIVDNKVPTTYKIYRRNKESYYLAPINTLEEGEFTEFSSKPDNNKFYSQEYYKLKKEYLDNKQEIAKYSLSKIKEDNDKVGDIEERNKEIHELLTTQIASFKPVKVKGKVLVESVENPTYMTDVANSNSKDAPVVAKFIDDIVEGYDKRDDNNRFVIMNNTIAIANMFPFGKIGIQTINTKDGVTKLAIRQIHLTPNSRTTLTHAFKVGYLDNNLLNKLSAKNAIMVRIAFNANMINPTFYEIKDITEQTEDVTTEIPEIAYDLDSDDFMYAVTPLLDENEFGSTDFTLAGLAKGLATDISKDATIRGEQIAKDFMESDKIAGVDFNDIESINGNIDNILAAEAEYMTREARRINSTLDKFYLQGEFELDGTQQREAIMGRSEFGGDNVTDVIYYYSADDPNLYKYLQNNPEEFDRLAKVLLQARKLVAAQEALLKHDVRSENPEVQRNIELIRKAVISIRNNKKLNTAFGLIFNNYIASMYSTNPIIRHGIIDLRVQFGEIEWMDLQLSDIHELNHKQIQAVVKAVNQIIDHARMHVIPKALESFDEQWKKIEQEHGKVDLNRIINHEGKIVQEYTEDFITDGRNLRERMYDIKAEHGVDSIEYHRAKLEYDTWKAVYTHQPAAKEYYLNDVAYRQEILDKAPDVYIEYMRLTRELYDNGTSFETEGVDENTRRKNLRLAIYNLQNPIQEDVFGGDMEYEVKQHKAKLLKDYIRKRQRNNSNYFYYEESDGFKETLEEYIGVIESYDKRHPFEDFAVKMENDAYREAYEWIEANTIKTQDKESLEKINNAFEALTKDGGTANASLTKLAIERDAYDAGGELDGRRFTDEDIESIREHTLNNYISALGNGVSDESLIKDVPTDDRVYNTTFYTILKGNRNENAKEWDANPVRIQMIKEINSLLRKGMRGHTDAIVSARGLHENLSVAELERLANLYYQLGELQSERPKGKKDAYKDVLEFKTNNAAYNQQLAYIYNLDKTNPLRQTLLDIFQDAYGRDTYTGKKAYKDVANPFIYGYIEGSDKYLDKTKTSAKALLKNGTEVVTTKYYTLAARQAQKEGRYDEWYEKNHVYNQITGRIEPLRIWTKTIAKSYTDPVYGEIHGGFIYTPTMENSQRSVIESKRNEKYDKIGYNYDNDSHNLAATRGMKSYDNGAGYTEAEIAMANLIRNTLTMYADTYSTKRFIADGYMPRRANVDINGRWFAHQALGALGLTLRDTSRDTWNDDISYENDREVEFDMIGLLKNKESKDYIIPLDRNKFDSDAEYREHLKEVREKNEEIKRNNEAVDANILNRDWQNVMRDYIKGAIDVNTRNQSKNIVYLLIEDLKNNPSYKQSGFSGRLRTDNKHSTTGYTAYKTVDQHKALELLNTWANRQIFGNFKEASKLTKYADMLQGMTSAKYMIFNVTGGIANIGTGMAGIMGEAFAGEYFNFGDYLGAEKEYISSILTILKDTYSEKGGNKTSALLKYFDIVDYNAILEKNAQEGVIEYVERARNAMYSLQTSGEHFMQNTALLAALRSHRVYTNEDGKIVTGTIDNYSRDVEIQVLKGMIADNEELRAKFNKYIKNIKNDLEVARQYDRFNKHIVTDFLREVGDAKLVDEYNKLKKEAKEKAKKEFQALPKVYDELVYDNASKTIKIKTGSSLTEEAIELLKSKVFRINNRIHGVYNKIGAANIERKWWGSLVMQYHKHLYPGFMKRFRRKGIYNETRETIEKGSYLTAMELIFGEYTNMKLNKDENAVIGSLKAIVKASANTILNIKTRYNLMEDYEKANLRRVLGDIYGIGSAFLMAVLLYAMFDDDDVKDSNMLSTILYSADRMFAESNMWHPMGLFNEAKTLWSSPIAALNTNSDIITAVNLGIQYMTKDDFNPDYTTGLYKGKNKFGVLLGRNIPGYRVYKRLQNMSKNNQYYRINDNSLSMKTAKNVGGIINPDE